MIALSSLRNLMDGVVPSTVATCDPDGTPNVSFVSQLHYVDETHVALSFQFFSKTRRNVLANPRAAVVALDPQTGIQYRFALEYLRTETEGPLFESMKAKLAGIASHEGMSDVFRLQGSDLYRVLDIERLPGGEVAAPARPSLLPAVRAVAERVARCTDLATLLDEVLSALESILDIRHAMVLLTEARDEQLYTVASRGYERSGIGAEIAFGDGVIGVAARARTPIRLTHAAAEYSYGRAVREHAAAGGFVAGLTTQIPFAGLERAGSQLAVPITAGGQLLGVLYVESPEEQRFRYDDEDALVTIAAQFGVAIRLLQQAEEREEVASAGVPSRPRESGAPASVRHYRENDSVFVGDDYLIKGVAGAILWKLLRDYAASGRTEFTNRELRLDPAIRLPELSENLEARLILLQRRLVERCAFVRLDRSERGRVRLVVTRPLQLTEAGA
ncbi:MAG: GAF domain-containing protein [Proteobacteria bacterium]|nr:GAF domain-containing protein [Pseudomonadota bacterium]